MIGLDRRGWLATVVIALTSLALWAGGCRTNQPMGDQFSDGWITTKVKSKLAADPEVSALNVSVTTEEGVVFLTGRVANEHQREEAVRLARNTEGVRDVVDHLSVGAYGTNATGSN
jgi:hyperosmotically inducible protein